MHGATRTARPPTWLLTIFTGAGTLGVHIFAPALPLVAAQFNVSAADTQFTISLYMVALASGQLLYGPLSDLFGRKPVLIAGLGVYVLSGIVAAVSTSLEMLIVARIVQGLGGCAGQVLGRAIVQDISEGSNSVATTIATLNIVQLAASAIAPLVGLGLATQIGWRMVPAMLCALGVAGIAGTLFVLAETNAKRVTKWSPRSYAAVFRAPGFMVNLAVGAFTTTTLFNLLSTMPFVLIHNLGRSESEVGYSYSVLIVGIISGGYMMRRWASHVSLDAITLLTTVVGAVSGLLLLILTVGSWVDLISYMILGFVFTLTCGVMGVAALAQCVANVGDLKGTAVGLYGFTQMCTGAISIMLGSMGPDVGLTSAVTMAVFAWAGLLIHLAGRYGGRAGPEARVKSPS